MQKAKSLKCHMIQLSLLFSFIIVISSETIRKRWQRTQGIPVARSICGLSRPRFSFTQNFLLMFIRYVPYNLTYLRLDLINLALAACYWYIGRTRICSVWKFNNDSMVCLIHCFVRRMFIAILLYVVALVSIRWPVIQICLILLWFQWEIKADYRYRHAH